MLLPSLGVLVPSSLHGSFLTFLNKMKRMKTHSMHGAVSMYHGICVLKLGAYSLVPTNETWISGRQGCVAHAQTVDTRPISERKCDLGSMLGVSVNSLESRPIKIRPGIYCMCN